MWPLFGSTFFYVKNVFDTRIHADCILAINKLGVYFLNKESHVKLKLIDLFLYFILNIFF